MYGKLTFGGDCKDLLASFDGLGEPGKAQVVMAEVQTILSVYIEVQMPYSSSLSMASRLSNLRSAAIIFIEYADANDVWACLITKGICRLAERVNLICYALHVRADVEEITHRMELFGGLAML